jgi:tripartite-type tricarboxylate transporter receptor subunit TctC
MARAHARRRHRSVELTMRRRTLLLAAPAAVAQPAAARTILPDQGLYILTGYQSTGGGDVIARRIARQLELRIGRRVTVENRSGDSGTAPGEVVRRGSPDGKVLAFLSSTTLVTRLGHRNFPFDPLTDLAPITLAGTWPLALAVSPLLPVTTLQEYLGWLKGGGPERHKLGNTTAESFIEVFNRLFARRLDITMDNVNYPGAGPLVDDLTRGRLPAAILGVPSLLSHHRGGRVRILVVTSRHRLAVASDIPTARELGIVGVDTLEWYAFFANAGTPPRLIAEWNRQLDLALHDGAVPDDLAQLGMQVATSTPQELAARVTSHLEEWSARMIAVGMKPVI